MEASGIPIASNRMQLAVAGSMSGSRTTEFVRLRGSSICRSGTWKSWCATVRWTVSGAHLDRVFRAGSPVSRVAANFVHEAAGRWAWLGPLLSGSERENGMSGPSPFSFPEWGNEQPRGGFFVARWLESGHRRKPISGATHAAKDFISKSHPLAQIHHCGVGGYCDHSLGLVVVVIAGGYVALLPAPECSAAR
jgi:hypothetical protein